MEDAGGILQRDALIGLNSYWRIKLFAYDASSNIEYMGCNAQQDAATSANTWVIWKFIYTGSSLTSIEGPITGVYDDRATLAWN
jgi:hypothetical protein